VVVFARHFYRRHARGVERARGQGGCGAVGLGGGAAEGRWSEDYRAWRRSKLGKERWVYLWADGIYSGLRAEDEQLCALVVIAVNERGQKKFLAIEDGMRESTQSWREVLLEAQDGQRAELPPQIRAAQAKAALHEIWMAETKAEAQRAFDQFVATFAAKYPKAVECLAKDPAELLAFYDFPAEHWIHLRTSNPIESTFATVPHRTDRTKGCLTRDGMLAMIFKLGMSAQRSWRQLRGFGCLAKVIDGVKFRDGIEIHEQQSNRRVQTPRQGCRLISSRTPDCREGRNCRERSGCPGGDGRKLLGMALPKAEDDPLCADRHPADISSHRLLHVLGAGFLPAQAAWLTCVNHAARASA
jgi:hypothetical protein